MLNSRICRAIRIGSVLMTVLLLTNACGLLDKSGGGNALTVVSYGGSYQRAQATAMFEPYERLHPGLTIFQDSPSANAKLRVMVENGNPTWDVVLLANDFGNDAQAQWLEPIDYSVVDENALLPGYAGKYRVGADVEGTVMTVRTDRGAAPNSLAEFFDTAKFPGKRALNKFAAGGILEAALLADGVTQDELYPLDVDRALRKLSTIRDSIVWWDTAAQSQQLIASGEAAMGLLWVGRATEAAKTAPVKLNWQSWISQDAYWMVPKGSPNKDAAMKLIQFMTSYQPQKQFSLLTGYGPVNREAADDPEVRANPDIPSNHISTRVTMNDAWWAANLDQVQGEFQAWLLQ